MSRWTAVKLGLLVVLVVTAVVVQLLVGLPSQAELRDALDRLAFWGPLVFVAIYVGANLLPASPSAVITVAGGALFGFPAGLALALVGANLGSLAGFTLSRVLGRGAVQDVDSRFVGRVDVRVREHGFVTVLIARLIPLVPFATAHYVFGLTSVRLRDYAAATALGALPGTAVYVAVGAFGSDPGSLPFLLALGALVLLSLVGLLRRRSRGSSESAEEARAG